MRIFTLFIGALLSLPASAAIYQSVDANGNVIFSDKPLGEDATPVELRKPSVYTPRNITGQGASAGDEAEGDTPKAQNIVYKRVEILSPTQDETIRDNTGLVPLSVGLQPRLREGDSLTVMMNGEVMVKGLKTTSLPMSNIDRGSHELVVLVIDETGAEVGRSEPVTFHLHRAALGGVRAN